MSRQGRIRQAARSGGPLRDANFMPKRQRKAVRRGMVRGYLANKVADRQAAREDRAEFYRNLRQIKLHRRVIARQMWLLASSVAGLRSQVRRIEVLYPEIDIRFVEEVEGAIRVAELAVQAAASEFYAFSRARIYYSEDLVRA